MVNNSGRAVARPWYEGVRLLLYDIHSQAEPMIWSATDDG